MDITVSIVSHGHDAEIALLLRDLRVLRDSRLRRVIVTLNVPPVADAPAGPWPFELEWLRNERPLGFGANHNRAFVHDTLLGASPLFAVLNPDLRLHTNPFDALVTALQSDPRAGAAYPVQRDAAGRAQDHERLWPTPGRLLARVLLHRKHEVCEGETPDWDNGAFLLLRSTAYAGVDGFDERYHLYCEDVDLCLRLQAAGWRLARADAAVVEHTAQRSSHRRMQHLAWHLRSLWRLWCSPAWRHRPRH